MKNKSKFLIVLTLVIVFLFYRVDSVVAMANELPDMSDVNAEASQSMEPASEPVEPEQDVEPIVELAESEQIIDSVAESVEPEQNAAPIVEPVVPESLQTTESAPDLVSTGPALIEWLESHKNTGGTVKLTDHVTLDGYYCFCPNGINKPAVHVDTDQYTITVAGEIEFMSDNQLTFSGQPDGNGIFCVAAQGMLSVAGIAVESGRCALWQEEGAGLVIEDCRISGSVHYADIPFVTERNLVCIVVDKGQTLQDVLPSHISCTVNRQGKLSHNEMVPLTWNLEGSDRQQEERRRFQIQGSFLHAASAAPVSCTVVYNDYPLTFTDVAASVSGSMYMFRGGYTKPEGALPIKVLSEYSFDGDNWITYDETNVTYYNEGFFIALQSEERDAASYPNIYIRLQWNDNGTPLFSNVLCFAADNLEYVEDIGGSRGGGTSITNPPEEPQKTAEDTVSKEEKPAPAANQDTDSGNAGSEAPQDTNQTESGAGSHDSNAADAGRVFSAIPSKINAGQSANAESVNNNGKQPKHTESKVSNTEQSLYTDSETDIADNSVRNTSTSVNNENTDRNDSDISEKEETVTALSVYGVNSAPSPVINEQTLRSGIRGGNALVIAAGFVLLSVIAGIVGFYLQSRRQRTR